MMHLYNIMVAICDSTRKTFREYESKRSQDGRRSKVFIPFDSEYQFYVKNNQSSRIKLDIFIDGSMITDKGLIINGNENSYIERFIDTDKKFKFVRASHEAVSDPTSPENGVIKVIAHKEKVLPIITVAPQYVPYWAPNWEPSWPPYNHTRPVKRYMVDPAWTTYDSNTRGGSSLGNINISNVSCYSASVASADSGPPIEAGATVEGSSSNQIFGSTYWNGDDGSPMCFTFYAVGVRPETDVVRERKVAEYYKLKEELRL